MNKRLSKKKIPPHINTVKSNTKIRTALLFGVNIQLKINAITKLRFSGRDGRDGIPGPPGPAGKPGHAG